MAIEDVRPAGGGARQHCPSLSRRLPHALLVWQGGGYAARKFFRGPWTVERGPTGVERMGGVIVLSSHAGACSYLIHDSLTSLEGRLPGSFTRIHRSTIVNHRRVVAVRPRGGLDHVVELRNGAELRLSRTYYRRVLTRIRDVE